MLLKNFCDQAGQIWVCDKNTGKIVPRNPKTVFSVRHLYTSYDIGPVPKSEKYEKFRSVIKRDSKYENTLNRIESKAAPVVQRLIEQARCDRFPQLTPEDRDAVKRFILALGRRTPESQKRVSSGKNIDDIFYEAAKDIARKDNYKGLPDRELIYQDPRISTLKDLTGSNVNARFAAGDHPREQSNAERFCRETGLMVAVIRIPKRSFVIGSHGVTIVQFPNKVAPESWIPIAYDVAVVPTSFPDREFLFPLGGDKDQLIKRVNMASFQQSRRVAGCSEDLLKSLSKTDPVTF